METLSLAPAPATKYFYVDMEPSEEFKKFLNSLKKIE